MHISGSQLSHSRFAYSLGERALDNDRASADQAASANNSIKQGYIAEAGKQPYYSLGGGFGGHGGTQFYQNIQEAMEALSNGSNVELELDDPSLRTDFGTDADGNAIQGPDAEYRDIDGEVFVGGASLTDVKQGAIGNCYLMAALASIAQHNPKLLERLITDNGNGTYTVHFQGGMGDVTIDDDFAVRTDDGSVLYAQTDTGGADPELWVAIIEKAYAQGNGGFQQTVGGWAHAALAEITGQNYTTGTTSNFSPEELQAALVNGQSVTASSLTKEDAKKADLGTGIISNHAYVVTDVQQNSKGEWQVTVYNPWGSDRATADGKNDGLTVLSLDEFNDNFRAAAVMNEPFANVA